jgi:hypothetical protein
MVLLEKVVEAEDLVCATSKENYKSFLEILMKIPETWGWGKGSGLIPGYIVSIQRFYN